ncbi:fasciculation and elongation protein zeta-1 isoform X2 [Gasterosteus aculeatus]|uniref:fasciculation and elongation protein zeta-1 isoform X2 n=1 Tax=Gasterosteus aculeatus aculeatus TaxID=481459 RepID=UPI001A99EA9F|nr:fasciculation and elongation protein zeta-1 isoform X2 [Gasterosteus aculeatus aculeatus]
MAGELTAWLNGGHCESGCGQCHLEHGLGLSQPLSRGGKQHKGDLSPSVIRPSTDSCCGLQSQSGGTMIVWDALTDNYSSTWDGTDSEGLNGNLSELEIHEKEEEEMNEKNDNANCLKEEPLITADQVIEEIVEMMENSPDPGETEEEEDEEESSPCSSRTNPSLLEEIRQLSQASNNNCSYEGLSLMPSSALVELLHRVEAAILEYSEELVSQLARREELEFEKEVKNTFITALMEVQNRQKEQRDSSKRRRRDKALSLQGGVTSPENGGDTTSTGNSEKTGSMPVKRFSMEGLSNILQTGIRQTFGSTGNDKQYLNTVIPYEKKVSLPTVDDLQMLTKILYAMKEDSEKVPTLLTDYILKVLCPT